MGVRRATGACLTGLLRVCHVARQSTTFYTGKDGSPAQRRHGLTFVECVVR